MIGHLLNRQCRTKSVDVASLDGSGGFNKDETDSWVARFCRVHKLSANERLDAERREMYVKYRVYFDGMVTLTRGDYIEMTDGLEPSSRLTVEENVHISVPGHHVCVLVSDEQRGP